MRLECESNDLPYVILRPTGVFGYGDDYTMFQVIKSVNMGLFFFVPTPSGLIKYCYTMF